MRGPVPQVLIFDLDGTLVDSFNDIGAALNHTRALFDLPPLPLPEIVREVGSGSAQLVKQLVPVSGDNFQEAFQSYLRLYEEHALDQSCLYDGVSEVLEYYRARQMAVVTNKNIDLSEKILSGLGIRDCFQVVLGGDSLERKKPDPLPIDHVLKAFSSAPGNCVMIGDGLHDIHAGKAAGVKTVGVATGVESRSTLAAENPDHLIDCMKELPVIFR